MHFLEHAFFDSLKIVPFIFTIYLVIEYFEHKNNTWLSHRLMKSKKCGAIYGALLGSIPQCGFSVIAADLFSRRSVTMGTLIAIFVATSDEAVPIILSTPENAHLILKVIGIKVVIAIAAGLLIDALVKSKDPTAHCTEGSHHEHFHGNCENCDDGILKSAAKHTLKIFAFIFLATLILTFMIESVGEEKLAGYLLKDTVFQPFIAALIGLIPNCAASVILTKSFLSGAISFGSLIAGLSSGAGVGILVLVKRNKNVKENIFIIGALYFIGALSGIILQTICI